MSEKTRERINKWLRILFTPMNKNESIFQWLFRNIILTDSQGFPSWTFTLTFIIMVYTGALISTEISLAIVPIQTFDPATGKVISSSIRGISNHCWYAMFLLIGAVVFFIKFRDQRNSQMPTPTEADAKPESIITTVIDAAKNIVGK